MCVSVSCVFFLFVFFFFVQAEDGIRDLVRSRGLGDEYKRQGRCTLETFVRILESLNSATDLQDVLAAPTRSIEAVSYTHLTLPTSDLV